MLVCRSFVFSISGLTEAARACRLILFLVCSAHLSTRGRLCVCVLAGATTTPTANRNGETLETVTDLRSVMTLDTVWSTVRALFWLGISFRMVIKVERLKSGKCAQPSSRKQIQIVIAEAPEHALTGYVAPISYDMQNLRLSKPYYHHQLLLCGALATP